MKKMKWGIVGSGKIARRFAADLKLLSDAELSGVFSRNRESLREFCSVFETTSYHSMPDLLNSDVDVIYVATPHSSHHEITLQSLDAGKAVLCEKPFSMNTFQSEEMYTIARSKNLFVMEAMWTRFFPAIKECLKIVKSGQIGKIIKIESSFGYHSVFDPDSRIFNPELGGGSILDVGIYTIALVRMFLDEKPDHLESNVLMSSSGVDETAFWKMSFPSGVKANGESSVVKVLSNEALIQCSHGEIRIPRFWHPEEFFLNGVRYEFPYTGMGFQFEASEVMRNLRSGAFESDDWSSQHSLDVMKIMDKILKK